MYRLLRTLLFQLDAERSHDIALACLARASNNAGLCQNIARRAQKNLPVQSRQVMGVDFPNPLGLAAGFDKNARCINFFSALGFGAVEVGTLTPQPQAGNPKPRLFRLRESESLINRLGFNGVGLEIFLQNLRRANAKTRAIVGVNIGKNATTPKADAKRDYLACLRGVYADADYVALNISSPNTEGLRELQNADALDDLLAAVCNERDRLADQHGMRRPLVVKISPDLTAEQIQAVAALARRRRIDGIAAANTTLERARVRGQKHADERGGLSGRPLAEKSCEVIRMLRENLQGEVAIIGIGGVDSAKTARDKLHAGADLIQIYTGLVYQGPRLIGEILRGLD